MPIANTHSVDAVGVNRDSRLLGRTIGEVDVRGHRLQLCGVVSGREGTPDPVCHSYPFADQRFFFNPRSEFRLESEDLLIG